MKTATFVKHVDRSTNGDMRIYRLSPPMAYEDYMDDVQWITEYVAVSAADVMFSGPETYIFPSDGEFVSDWGELPGSFKGSLDHEAALNAAGYTLTGMTAETTTTPIGDHHEDHRTAR